MYIRYCFLIKLIYQIRRIPNRLDGACRFDFNLNISKSLWHPVSICTAATILLGIYIETPTQRRILPDIDSANHPPSYPNHHPHHKRHKFKLKMLVFSVNIFKEAKVTMCHLAAAFDFKSLVNKHVILKYPPVLSSAALKFYCIPAQQPMLSLKYDYFSYKWSLLQSHSCLAICVMTSVFYMGNTDSKEVFITLLIQVDTRAPSHNIPELLIN